MFIIQVYKFGAEQLLRGPRRGLFRAGPCAADAEEEPAPEAAPDAAPEPAPGPCAAPEEEEPALEGPWEPQADALQEEADKEEDPKDDADAKIEAASEGSGPSCPRSRRTRLILDSVALTERKALV